MRSAGTDGYIVQSTGDGIFTLFGAPLAHEDHPQRALYAALRMKEELKRYSARLRELGNLPVEARVGVNTGEVVVRSITTGEGHTEYTPIGHQGGRLDGARDLLGLAPQSVVLPAGDHFFVNDTATTEIYTLSLHEELIG